MRIDVIVVIAGLSEKQLADRQSNLSRYGSGDTEINMVVTSKAPDSVESQAELELAAPGILQRCVESEQSGADGIVIWGGHDPSLEAARELVSIPVIGPGMASMYLASSLARQFGLLVQLPNVVGLAKRQVQDLGLEWRCSGVYSAGVPVLEYGTDHSFDCLLKASESAIRDGADAICFGCMAMTGQVDRVRASIAVSHPGVIVINPGLAAIRFAELCVSLGLSHSKRSYPDPPKPVVFG